jgi:Domain of unknown function (DUF4190)/GYF domain 2
MQIHVAREGKQLGIFSLEEINRQLAAGTLSLSDQAWYEGAAGWAALSTVPGVGATAAPASPSPISSLTPTAVPIAVTAVVPARKTEQLAVLSIIFSGLGLFGFCCGLFLMAGVAGIVCGHIALSRVKANPELEGHGLAVAGLVIGYLAVAGWLAWVVLFGGLAVLQGITESLTKH